MLNARCHASRQGGFLLIEALVAILIFSVGVIALIGLQSLSLSNSLHGKYRADAGYLANGIIAQMMADRTNVASYVDGASPQATQRGEWDTEVAAALPNGSGSIAMSGSAVTVVVGWRSPDETSGHNHTAVAQVVF